MNEVKPGNIYSNVGSDYQLMVLSIKGVFAACISMDEVAFYPWNLCVIEVAELKRGWEFEGRDPKLFECTIGINDSGFVKRSQAGSLHLEISALKTEIEKLKGEKKALESDLMFTEHHLKDTNSKLIEVISKLAEALETYA